MTNVTVPSIQDFDPVARTAKYTECIVRANGVDPVTGVNTGTIDVTTPLTFFYVQGGGAGGIPGPNPRVLVDQIALLGDGTRVLRWRPGVLQATETSQPWSIRITAPPGTNQITQMGTTPPPADVSGVTPVGVETDTQPV